MGEGSAKGQRPRLGQRATGADVSETVNRKRW